MSQYDIPGLYDFLHQTPEQGLRKMLVDSKSFTEPHFNLMIKILRACNQTQFSEHFEKSDFPKIKLGPAEIKLKEKFWADCVVIWKSRGLLNPGLPQKAAA